MSSLSHQDIVLLAIAILVMATCLVAVVYMITSAARSEAASMKATTEAFRKQLSEPKHRESA